MRVKEFGGLSFGVSGFCGLGVWGFGETSEWGQFGAFESLRGFGVIRAPGFVGKPLNWDLFSLVKGPFLRGFRHQPLYL